MREFRIGMGLGMMLLATAACGKPAPKNAWECPGAGQNACTFTPALAEPTTTNWNPADPNGTIELHVAGFEALPRSVFTRADGGWECDPCFLKVEGKRVFIPDGPKAQPKASR